MGSRRCAHCGAPLELEAASLADVALVVASAPTAAIRKVATEKLRTAMKALRSTLDLADRILHDAERQHRGEVARA